MRKTFLMTLLAFLFVACNSPNEEKSEPEDEKKAEMTFDKTKWRFEEGLDYPYRDQMVNDVLYNDTIRSLDKDEILELLGDPDRINEGHLYYTIAKKRMGLWTLHAKTMVIKLKENDAIEWIKIHE